MGTQNYRDMDMNIKIALRNNNVSFSGGGSGRLFSNLYFFQPYMPGF